MAALGSLYWAFEILSLLNFQNSMQFYKQGQNGKYKARMFSPLIVLIKKKEI
jgi:hypothetical protein